MNPMRVDSISIFNAVKIEIQRDESCENVTVTVQGEKGWPTRIRIYGDDKPPEIVNLPDAEPEEDPKEEDDD